ncbi:MAG TPA: sulfite exporter TauE/SafE family protein, partial [Calditerricola sp.]
MALVLLLILGVVAGVLGSLLGLGGGVVLVPALLSLSGLWGEAYTPQEAVGTSLAVVAATGLSSTLAYLRHGKVDESSALFFFLASGPGAAVGVWANRFLDGQRFFLLFGLLLVGLFFLLAVRDRIRPRPGRWTVVRTLKTPEGEVTYGYRRRVALPVA